MFYRVNATKIPEANANVKINRVPPKPQAETALSRIKRVTVWVQLTLILHPSGAAGNVKNLFLPQVKNLAYGLGFNLNPKRESFHHFHFFYFHFFYSHFFVKFRESALVISEGLMVK